MSYRNARFRPLELVAKRALYDLPRPEVARMIFDEDDEIVVVDHMFGSESDNEAKAQILVLGRAVIT